MPKIKDLPKFRRPREKLFERGPEALKDAELLAILLRTGYQGKSALEVARRLLKRKNLKDLLKLHPDELSKIKGIGKSRASTVTAGFELAKRAFKQSPSVTIVSPEDVLKVVSDLRSKKREYLVCLYLNARSELLRKHTVSVGILTQNLVHPREVFAPAIKNHAASIILVHNHPSGTTEPSRDDIEVTRDLKEAGHLLGIEVVDHVIVSKENYTSFREEQLL